ncbi:MAG: CoA-binding protein [Acidimicrobiales bacterium]
MKIEEEAVHEFLGQSHLAVVGASNNPKNLGNTIYRELRDHEYQVVPVNPKAVLVEGDQCYSDVTSIPDAIDGVVVIVGGGKSVDVVRACVQRGIKYVWLFKGVGGPGSVSDEAVELCREHGIHVVAGACPLMFLEPVGWFHRAHRAVRHLNGSLAKAS